MRVWQTIYKYSKQLEKNKRLFKTSYEGKIVQIKATWKEMNKDVPTFVINLMN